MAHQKQAWCYKCYIGTMAGSYWVRISISALTNNSWGVIKHSFIHSFIHSNDKQGFIKIPKGIRVTWTTPSSLLLATTKSYEFIVLASQPSVCPDNVPEA